MTDNTETDHQNTSNPAKQDNNGGEAFHSSSGKVPEQCLNREAESRNKHEPS